MRSVVFGYDLGRQTSYGVVAERREDGSWHVLEMVEGRGLDEVCGRTSAEQESDGGADGQSDGGPEMKNPGTR